MSNYTPSDSPKPTILGKIVVILFVVACGYGAWRLFSSRNPNPSAPAQPGVAASGGATFGASAPDAEIGIAYGTEKKLWLEWAAKEFAGTDAGREVRINLLPLRSLEGAQALLAGAPRLPCS